MLEKVLDAFGLAGEPRPFGDGHINTTYAVGDAYILQEINTYVFRDPVGMMKNCFAVTDHIRRRLAECGLDSDRRTLTFVPTVNGDLLYRGEEGTFRVSRRVQDSISYTEEKTPGHLAESARAIGSFQRWLSDFDAASLYTVIPDYHNTPKRLADFRAAVTRDTAGRAHRVREEIALCESLSWLAPVITDALADGRLPTRVTHNDTKLNNILFDRTTDRALCLIDLDTVMSGSVLFDFGDAMRFGANTAKEDENDPALVHFDPAVFTAFTEAYFDTMRDTLTETEKDMMFFGALLLTYENAIRFLADYLDGDVYYKIAFPEHNLNRTQNQLLLLQDMLRYRREAEEVIRACR